MIDVRSFRSARAPDADAASKIVNGLRANNVLISATGPLEENVDFSIDRMDRVMASLPAAR